MNTNKGSGDKNKSTFLTKEFTWKKTWVRPYESIYSILRNFCKVNVFQGSYAMNIFGIIEGNRKAPVPKLLMYGRSSITPHYYDILYNTLLPPWYIEQIMPISHLNIKIFSSVTKPTISYCPECKKENYHSFLFQFYEIHECPFHHISLINTERLYTSSSSIGYYVDSSSDSSYINLRDDILPCNRKQETSFYHLNNSLNFTHIIPISSEKEHLFQNMHRLFLKDTASRTFYFDKSNLQLRDLQQNFVTWFNTQNLPMNFCHPEQIWKLRPDVLPTFFCGSLLKTYLELVLYYSFYTFLNDLDLTNKAALFKIGSVYDRERVLYPHEIFELKISYIWAIISSSNPFYSLGNEWILSPRATLSENMRHIYNGVHFSDLNGYDIQDRVFVSEVDAIILLMHIIYDLFQTTWEQIISITNRDGVFSPFYGWKSISVPEYYICVNADLEKEGYTVFRFDTEETQ